MLPLAVQFLDDASVLKPVAVWEALTDIIAFNINPKALISRGLSLEASDGSAGRSHQRGTDSSAAHRVDFMYTVRCRSLSVDGFDGA